LISKNISELIIDNFDLTLNVSELDSLYENSIGEEEWNNLKKESIKHKNGVCQGCGFNPPDKEFIDIHIISGNVSNVDSWKIAVLCTTCHTLQHIDVASKNGWIKLVNSIYDQKKLVSLCRSGSSKLMEKINLREIILLNVEPIEYAESIKENSFNKRKQTKAVFGKNFPQNRLK
jgi:hypothetical protein